MMCTPFLTQEARYIALSRALRDLTVSALDDPARRAAAYADARLPPATDTEDAEALRRQRIYWRTVRPRVPAPWRPLLPVLAHG